MVAKMMLLTVILQPATCGQCCSLYTLVMQVSFVGHSAGAQLCTMALLHRAKAYSQQQQKAESHQKQGEPVIIDAQSDRSARNEDLRMPARLIGERLS